MYVLVVGLDDQPLDFSSQVTEKKPLQFFFKNFVPIIICPPPLPPQIMRVIIISPCIASSVNLKFWTNNNNN